MDSGTLQMLELLGWGVLMYWLFTATKSARKTAAEVSEKQHEGSPTEKS